MKMKFAIPFVVFSLLLFGCAAATVQTAPTTGTEVTVSPALAPTSSEVGSNPAPAAEEADPGDTLRDLLEKFLGYAGAGASVAVLVAFLKLPATLTRGKVVLIPDGMAGNIVVLGNLALFGAFVYAKVFYPNLNFDGINDQLQTWANYGVQIIGLIVQISASILGYAKMKEATPLVSYTEMATFKAK